MKTTKEDKNNDTFVASMRQIDEHIEEIKRLNKIINGEMKEFQQMVELTKNTTT